MVLPRAPVAALLLLAIYELTAFAANLQSNVLILLNKSSSDAVSLPTLNLSSSNDDDGDCFNPATPRRGLYPAKQEDCLNAVKELFYIRNPFFSTLFARRGNAGFKLPTVVRNRTCGISIDVMHDADKDFFKPILVYTTTRELALRCTQGAYRFGGRTMTGPKMVVDVLVFGRVWPLEHENSQPVASEGAISVAGEWSNGGDSSLLNETSLRLTEPVIRENISHVINSGMNSLNCYDPPLPRERAWAIDVQDCEMASQAIFTGRQPNQRYTFSREAVATNFYFPLPATFRHRSCVVHIDTNSDSDRDTVRLSIVEATVWVLAHKCSGEERSMEQYGGWATVGGGSKGLVNIWVYGRLWPSPIGATNQTGLIQARPRL